jgi:hypothetical protein
MPAAFLNRILIFTEKMHDELVSVDDFFFHLKY